MAMESRVWDALRLLSRRWLWGTQLSTRAEIMLFCIDFAIHAVTFRSHISFVADVITTGGWKLEKMIHKCKFNVSNWSQQVVTDIRTCWDDSYTVIINVLTSITVLFLFFRCHPKDFKHDIVLRTLSDQHKADSPAGVQILKPCISEMCWCVSGKLRKRKREESLHW